MSLPKKFLLKTSCCHNNITIVVNGKSCLLKHVEQVGELLQWHLYEWTQCNDEQEEEQCQKKEQEENGENDITNDILQALKELPYIQEAQLNQAKKRHEKR